MELLTYFNAQESEYKNLIDEYALTHPVSQKRINYIKANLSKFKNSKKIDPKIILEMRYVTAKLKAFLQDSDESLKYFNSKNPFDRYGLTIAYFKKGKLEKSLFEINELIKEQPTNGYFHELKGQILFENGLTKEAIKSYKTSIKLLPNPVLAKISLSSAILTLNSNDKDLVNFAIKNLNEAKIKENSNGQIFKELSIAYQKIGKKGKSYLALSELNLLKKDNKKSRKYAKRALEELDKNDKSSIIKANDILKTTKDEKSEGSNEEN